jgi:hypothetical protein
LGRGAGTARETWRKIRFRRAASRDDRLSTPGSAFWVFLRRRWRRGCPINGTRRMKPRVEMMIALLNLPTGRERRGDDVWPDPLDAFRAGIVAAAFKKLFSERSHDAALQSCDGPASDGAPAEMGQEREGPHTAARDPRRRRLCRPSPGRLPARVPLSPRRTPGR